MALEDVFTFCFTDTIVARNFLTEYGTREIRNIEISLRIKPIITELYYPGPDGEPQPHIGGIAITSKNNPWADLCHRLSSLPNLQTLHIRLDSEDLRPWHKRVNEKKFFEPLHQVKARKFVLDLPEIPDNPDLQALPGCYLEGVYLEEAPYKVKRSPRPNNWQLHLSRVSLLHVTPTSPLHCLLQNSTLWSLYNTSATKPLTDYLAMQISHVLPENWSHTLWNQVREKIQAV